VRSLLFLAHRIPYPPNKGDKIRSYHWLGHLARHYRVHLGTFVDDSQDLRHLPTVQALCAETYIARLDPRLARLRSTRGLLTGQPLTVPYYAHRGLAQWVRGLLAARRIDAVLVYSGAMAQYVPASLPDRVRSVCDFVDVDSDKWRQYAAALRGPMRWVYGREAARLERFERAVAWRFDASLFVSAAEAEQFRRIAPEVAERVTHADNGVDTEYFSPDHALDCPYPAGEESIVFTGAMDYWPNVDAVTWFVQEVLPAVREARSRAVFSIVGSRPTESVRRLAQVAGVRVTGAVDDIRPYLAHARVAVAPLRIARGVQNKVLEAMAMARPVAVSPQGLDGIGAVAGRELLVADAPRDFAARVAEVLADRVPPGLGAAARARVVADYAWQTSFARIDQLLCGESLPIAGASAHGNSLPASTER
jgi:sugar transferase (PEP-CTERM/EpsH1 system associated)